MNSYNTWELLASNLKPISIIMISEFTAENSMDEKSDNSFQISNPTNNKSFVLSILVITQLLKFVFFFFLKAYNEITKSMCRKFEECVYVLHSLKQFVKETEATCI